jgi:hypothetical protein
LAWGRRRAATKVEAKNELVEEGLKMILAQSVIKVQGPSLEVGKGEAIR